MYSYTEGDRQNVINLIADPKFIELSWETTKDTAMYKIRKACIDDRSSIIDYIKYGTHGNCIIVFRDADILGNILEDRIKMNIL